MSNEFEIARLISSSDFADDLIATLEDKGIQWHYKASIATNEKILKYREMGKAYHRMAKILREWQKT
jgi:hypothetical protein